MLEKNGLLSPGLVVSSDFQFNLGSIFRLLHSFVLALLPSFVRPQLSNATPPERRSSGGNVAALDGLRGLACLFVVNHHYTSIFTDAIYRGYGSTDKDCWMFQLPILNLPFRGSAMVAIFFVISGFVLSVKPLRLMRQKKWDSLQLALASSAFRRWFRLYLPLMASTMMVALASYVGLFDAARVVKREMNILTGNEDVPEKMALFAQIDQWWNSLLGMVRFGALNGLDPHLWTMPLETLSSMNLFISLAALSRLRFTPRLTMLCILIFIVIWFDWEGEFLFFVGALLADLHVAYASEPDSDVPRFLQQGPSTTRRTQRRVLYILALFAGMFLASSPELASTTPGYVWLESIKPDSWEGRPFWRYVGAITIVWVVSFYEDIQPLFTSRFAQYLGKVSVPTNTKTIFT